MLDGHVKRKENKRRETRVGEHFSNYGHLSYTTLNLIIIRWIGRPIVFIRNVGLEMITSSCMHMGIRIAKIFC